MSLKNVLKVKDPKLSTVLIDRNNVYAAVHGAIRELKMETFSGRRRPDWQSNPGTEVAVASLQNSNIKIAVNSGGRRL